MVDHNKGWDDFENRYLSGTDEIVDMIIEEGVISNLKSQIINTLNTKISAKIAKIPYDMGLDVQAHYLEDINNNEVKVIIEIQLGKTTAFPNSEVIAIEVCDEDDIKVLLTDNVARVAGSEPYNSFESIDEANRFLVHIYQMV